MGKFTKRQIIKKELIENVLKDVQNKIDNMFSNKKLPAPEDFEEKHSLLSKKTLEELYNNTKKMVKLENMDIQEEEIIYLELCEIILLKNLVNVNISISALERFQDLDRENLRRKIESWITI